ncbi:Wzz/FepE/Etk N-terminal domain-containing protein [Pseudomonas alcaligenes]|uniref:Wzz/FepE/Etk N-terminal domain-containing protein n=1 Tax=Pseudomonas sp. RIT-PI-AD TaxID=3035294 RepID=UPI0021DAAA23
MTTLSQRQDALETPEVDLFEIIRRLSDQWRFIAAVTLACLIASAVIAFTVRPVYEARASILPPLAPDISALNVGSARANLTVWSGESVYQMFLQALFGSSLRYQFFEDTYLPYLDEADRNRPRDQLWKDFNRHFSVEAPDKLKPFLLEVSAELEDPKVAADWVNGYIARAQALTLKRIDRTIRSDIDLRLTDIQRTIGVIEATALKRKADRIATLEEALRVAEAVGLENPKTNISRTAAGADLSNYLDGNLTYMRGAKAIRNEIAVLKARTSEEPFIGELRNLEEQEAFLRGVSIDLQKVTPAFVDQSALVPETPVRPRKSLILASGLVIGLLLGSLLALLRSAYLWQNLRAKRA